VGFSIVPLAMMSVLGARARARQNRSAQCSIFEGALAPRTYLALSHNFSGIEVFIQKCLLEPQKGVPWDPRERKGVGLKI
jgi:hypothetical protein